MRLNDEKLSKFVRLCAWIQTVPGKTFRFDSSENPELLKQLVELYIDTRTRALLNVEISNDYTRFRVYEPI